jgi:type 1 fimbria pilin
MEREANAMQQVKLTLAALLILGTASFAASKPMTHTFRGEIMDSACAKMGNHDAGYKMTDTSTPKDCTLACVKDGSKFVLFNSARKTTYQLDDQQKPEEFAGQKVRVLGTYNAKTKTIHVEKIEAGS